MVILGSSYGELEQIQNNLISELRKNKNLSRIESDCSKNKPEVKLIINKNKAKDLGVSTDQIGKTLETLYGGKTVTTFNKLEKNIQLLYKNIYQIEEVKKVCKNFCKSQNN